MICHKYDFKEYSYMLKIPITFIVITHDNTQMNFFIVINKKYLQKLTKTKKGRYYAKSNYR